MSARRKSHIKGGNWAWQLIDMLESPAWQVLSLSARRVIDRLQIELAHHAGHGNGNLMVTHAQFEEYGIHHDGVGPAIRECVALGFVEITRRGVAGNAGYRVAAKYRLTFRPSGNPNARKSDHIEATNDWRKIRSIEEAEAKAEQARKKIRHAAPRRAKNKTQSWNPGPGQSWIPGPVERKSPVLDSRTTVAPESKTTFYISGGEGGRGTEEALGA
jgi:hypothetical protein